jgi:hypothetical protein
LKATPIELPKYSVGVGDRFAQAAEAQLTACILAGEAGVDVVPVWNKSNREHLIIGSEPAMTRAAADAAVAKLAWDKPYFLDADHINENTVDRFLAPCDFFTMDVADYIGRPAAKEDVDAFVVRHSELKRDLKIDGINGALPVDEAFVRAVANKFLFAVQQAGTIYRKIAAAKGQGNFVTEISMDETDTPQTPLELLVILAAIADEKIPIQTIAPKFSGRFNKGVEYVGDVAQFAIEFDDDLATIAYAVQQYGFPANLKLSVHSGSDKYAIYSAIHAGMQRFDAGVHLKTAGTTWLEEIIGLSEAGGDALELAKDIYADAYEHAAELCAPYATVIDIRQSHLPSPATVRGWSSEKFVHALRHDGKNDPEYNPDLRQLLHVGFKIAAKIGPPYIDMLFANREVVARGVTTNLYERHLRPVFLGF